MSSYPAPGMMVMTPVASAALVRVPVSVPQQVRVRALTGFIPQADPTKWSTTAMDCCAEPGGCSRCCYVACCASCAAGKVAGSLPPDNGACCAGSEGGACIMHCLIGGSVYAVSSIFLGILTVAAIPVVGALTSCLHVSLRRGLKRQYGIADPPGGCDNDWVLAVCCDPCAICQELREIDLRRPQIMLHPGGMMPPGTMMMNPMHPVQQQYAQPGGGYPMQPMQPAPYYQPGAQQPGLTPLPPQQPVVYQATVQPVSGYAPATGYPSADKSKY